LAPVKREGENPSFKFKIVLIYQVLLQTSSLLKQTAQFNEMLIKVLAHNICVVIQEINELGVKAEFSLEQTREIPV